MNQQLLLLMALAGVVFLGAGMLLQRQLRRDEKLTTRVHSVQRTVGIDTVTVLADGSQSALLRLVAGLGEAITRRGLLSASALDDLEGRLRTAGFRGRNVLGLFIGAKLLLLIGLPVLAWALLHRTGLTPLLRMAAVAVAGIVGLLVPDQVVRLLHNRHLREVEHGLPDALDMMVICSEAGLGLEPSIERVGRRAATAGRQRSGSGHPHRSVDATSAGHRLP